MSAMNIVGLVVLFSIGLAPCEGAYVSRLSKYSSTFTASTIDPKFTLSGTTGGTTGGTASGSTTYGSTAPTTTVVVNGGSCTASAYAGTWAAAAGFWADKYVKAMNHACMGHTGEIMKELEGAAFAYAKIVLEVKTQCTSYGNAWGCANSKADAEAMARACYEAYLKAYAEAGNKDCECVTQAYSDAETTIKKFGSVWAKVEGMVSSSTCVYGFMIKGEKTTLDCYSHATALLWGQAIAEAFQTSGCSAISPSAPVCQEACGYQICQNNHPCTVAGWSHTITWAQAVLSVKESTSASCFKTVQENYDGEHYNTISANYVPGATSGGTGSSYQIATCFSEASASSYATAANAAVESIIDMMLIGCNHGYEHIPHEANKTAYALASIFSAALADCSTTETNVKYQDNTMGCAKASSAAWALAQACASAFASAWGQAKIKEDCGCKASVNADAWMEAGFYADLFAQAEGWTLAELGCLTGNTTLRKDAYLNCGAGAQVAVWSKAVLDLLVHGECTLEDTAVCDECLASTCSYGSHSQCLEDNQLYANSTALALAGATMSYNPGYCDIGGWGGEFGVWLSGGAIPLGDNNVVPPANR